ncbi:protein ABHD11 [Trichonephila clavata]|uniref:Protein ABHD11 n=1 Tax=Trichonephila clavata TaxID=2740835 RepID=A0A8X6FNI6_TRICU|nr:protein ABHD11 [Trichonephila clavata]
MVEKLVVEEMRIHKDDNQKPEIEEFIKKLKLAEEYVEKFPSSMSETEAHNKLQKLTSFMIFKEVPGEDSKPKPMAFTLPIYKDIDGTFKWDVNLKPIIRNLETIEVFDYELEEKQIYLGETLFISAEYSKLQVIDEKEVILKHFPNAEVFTAKGVFHCYHTEKATEFMEKIIYFIDD